MYSTYTVSLLSVDTLPYSTCIVLPNRYRTVLHSTLLYCTVLHLLYCAVLHLLYYTVLYMCSLLSVDTLPYSTCIVLPNRYRTVLHSTVLHLLYCTVLHLLYCTVLHLLYYTVLYMCSLLSVDTLPYSTCIIVLPNRYRTVLYCTCTVNSHFPIL